MLRPGFLAGLVLLVVACGTPLELPDVSIPERIGEGFDLDAVLEQVQDCERLRDTFVNVVSGAAAELDRLAEQNQGRVPQAELAEKVEAVAASPFFAIAERLGCERLEMQAATVERLRELAADSEAGQELIDEVTRRVEQSSA